jgi:MFS family permease
LLAALLLAGGPLGDLYGRRKMFAAGVALFSVASAWCGLAPNIRQLILARSLQGIGGALLVRREEYSPAGLSDAAENAPVGTKSH